LVRARRRKGELVLVGVEGDERQEALYLAGLYLDLVRAAVGRPRAQLDEAFAQVEAPPPLQRVADGLRKLIEDRCEFEPTVDLPPEELRREVFRLAAERRRALGPDEPFDRAAVLADAARARGVAAGDLERGLYADLRGAHVLRSFEPMTPEALVAAYDDAQAQAVLLRAVKVRAEVTCGAAWGYRQLFAKLKFLRLLHAIEPLGGGYRIDIDGPFSLFDSVTKYGLQLALSLPAVQACATWSIEADVRWGKMREALVFRLAGRGPDAREGGAFALPPEVEAFRQGFEALKSAWRVSPSPAILNLPGAGLCVPDLVFERPGGPRVYFEVLGYWSREAVWRRVDLVRQGLGEHLLVAVSERLRVSEDVLGDDPSGALYVYKGALSPRVVLKRLEARWGRGEAGETLPLPVAAPPPATPRPSNGAGAPPARRAPAGTGKAPPAGAAGARNEAVSAEAVGAAETKSAAKKPRAGKAARGGAASAGSAPAPFDGRGAAGEGAAASGRPARGEGAPTKAIAESVGGPTSTAERAEAPSSRRRRAKNASGAPAGARTRTRHGAAADAAVDTEP
jgi:hypothetical protein